MTLIANSCTHGIELLAPQVVFKPRDRRLRGERVARDAGPARAVACEWGRQRGGPHRCHRDGHTQCRRSAGPADPPAYAGPCRAAGSSTRHSANPSISPYCRSAAFSKTDAAIGARMLLIESSRRGACRRDPGREQSVIPCRPLRKRLRCDERSVSAAFVPHGGVCVTTVIGCDSAAEMRSQADAAQ